MTGLSPMNRGAIALIFPIIAITLDVAMFLLLERKIQTPAILRLVSLCSGLGIAWAVVRCVGASRKIVGYWPLVAATSFLSYSIYLGLAYRIPQLQTPASLLLSWLGALLFASYGAKRINRWR